MNITVNLNNEKNGIELIFEAKPGADTLAAIKAQGFRWHAAKRFWYAKQTADRLKFVESFGTVPTASTVAPVNSINMDGVGSKPYFGAGAELAKAIREEFKARGVKGCTVRVDHYDSITVTVKATPADMASIEEASERHSQFDFERLVNGYGVYGGNGWIYQSDLERMSEEEREGAYYKYLDYSICKYNEFSYYHHEHNAHCWELTEAFYNKCLCILQIANQWNYDNSDSMSDYFDRGYYLTIAIKKADDFEPRTTMTDEERTAYTEEQERKEREKAEALERMKEEQEQARIESEKRDKWLKESERLIYDDITVEDLNESNRIYITSIVGGIGKECNLEELKETIEENPHYNDALISRAVRFTSPEAYERFTSMFLCDFEFLAHQGGTASEDVRLEEVKELYQLNDEQRESVKFYCNNCVAVYLDDDLKLIIDPQGFDYARYVFILSEKSEILTASKELEAQAQASKEKEPFYFPTPLSEQIESIAIGDKVTIYQCDGWILNNIYGGSGSVIGIKPGTYAQYNGYYIELNNGRKCSTAFIRDSKECLIYRGIKPLLPESVTHRRINDRMTESFNYDVLFPNVYAYYKELGELPIIDTWQR